MNEFICESCGAIYTSEGEQIPSEIACICEGKNFKIMEKEL